MDFNEHQMARLDEWWRLLDDDGRRRALALPAHAPLPMDLAQSLNASRVTFATFWWVDVPDSDVATQPSELRGFLDEKRQKQAEHP
jgi:hypothetical protein